MEIHPAAGRTGYVIQAVRNKGITAWDWKFADVLTVAELHSVLDTK